MKTSEDDNRSAPEAAAFESGPAPRALDSSAPENAFDARIATLQTYLEHAPELDAESRAEYCADAHRIALAALEAALDDEKRSLALKLDAQLCVWEADGRAEPDRTELLQRAVAKLEQATQLDSSNIGAHKLLARALTKLADRDDQFREAYTGFERKSVSAPADWRVWHDWANTLTEHAQRVDGIRARELLREAAELLLRGRDAVTEPQARARLSDDRGLTLRALASRSSVPDGILHLEESELEFQRATEREPELEAAWSHWADLLLDRARLAAAEPRRELQNRALEVLWRGMQSMSEPQAACRLSIQRAQALLAIALSGGVEECEARFEEAMHELARAIERDVASAAALSLAAEVCCVRAQLAEPKRASVLLRDALAFNARGAVLAQSQIGKAPELRARLHCQRGSIWRALSELQAGRARRISLENAVLEFEHAAAVCPTDLETVVTTARFWCDEARHAELGRARELTGRATELLLRAAEAASDDAVIAELRHAYGVAVLAAMDVDPGGTRDLVLAKATIAFQDACTSRRTYVAAWRSWSRLCSDCARRDGSDESALEQFQEADDVIDAAVQSLPLGEGTAELLTERACIFLAQAKRVRRAERLQCYERALACLEEAAQLAPALPAVWQAWGLALAERGRYDTLSDPHACFTQAYERYSRAADASALDRRHQVWLEFARELSRYARRDPDRASALAARVGERLEGAIAEVPRRTAELCLARGDLFAAAGRFTVAEAEYARGRDARTPVREALFCQHKLSALRQLHGLGKPDWWRTERAYQRYRRRYASRLDPEIVGTYGCLVYERLGPVPRAVQQLSAAIELRAPSVHRFRLAQVELARERAQTDPRAQELLGAWIEAARIAIEAGDIEPAERELELGKLALHRAELTRARKHFHTAASLDPWNATSCELLGLLALEQGDYEHACELLSAAHELASRSCEIQPLLAATLARLGEYADAELVFQQALACSPNEARVPLAWADACLAQAATSNEVELLARAHEYATSAIEWSHQGKSRRLPAHLLAQAHYARGYAAIRLSERVVDLERWQQARRDFRAALRLDPQHHEASRALARLTANGAITRLTFRRVAASVVGALALGIFVIAQIGFWPRVESVIQLCAGSACSDAFSLRALTLTGYVTLTFGALAFIALAVALPHWLQPKPASVPLERRPLALEPSRASVP